MEKKKNFYGWNIAAGSFFIMAMPFAVIFLSHSIFLKPVTEALGFSATQFSLVFTIVAIATALTSPVIGKIIKTYDIRYVMAISGAVVSLSFGAFGIVKELWKFYVLATIVGVSATGITQIPISNIITNWFPSKKKGLATGIAFAGGNVGSFLTIIIISYLIPILGYEKCYFLLGGIMFILTVLISLFVIKGKPEDIGQSPYGVIENKQRVKGENTQSIELQGYTLNEVKKTKIFWIFIVAIILLGIVFAGVQMHIPNYMESIGHSAAFASIITSTVAIVGITSNVIIGTILEKSGLKKGMVIVGVFMIMAIVCLLLGKLSAFAVLFAVLFGMFAAIAAMGPSYLTSEMFGKKDYGLILGIVMMFFQLGGALGPALSGVIFDITGEYKITWIIFIALLIVTFVTFLVSINLANKKRSIK